MQRLKVRGKLWAVSVISNDALGHDGYNSLQQAVRHANQHQELPPPQTRKPPAHFWIVLPEPSPPKHLWIYEENLRLLDSLLLPSDLKCCTGLETSPDDVKTLEVFYQLLCRVLRSLDGLVRCEDHVLWQWTRWYHNRLCLLLGDINNTLTTSDRQKEAPGPHALQKAPQDSEYKP